MIFNTVEVMLRTDDARRRTPDDGRRTMDPAPSTPYYKLTGELKRSLPTSFSGKNARETYD